MFAEQLQAADDAELSEWAASYWTAWHKLTRDRPLGAMGGAGNIPWSSIERYASHDGFDADVLARMMWAMDDVYLGWLADQMKKPTEKPSNAN